MQATEVSGDRPLAAQMATEIVAALIASEKYKASPHDVVRDQWNQYAERFAEWLGEGRTPDDWACREEFDALVRRVKVLESYMFLTIALAIAMVVLNPNQADPNISTPTPTPDGGVVKN